MGPNPIWCPYEKSPEDTQRCRGIYVYVVVTIPHRQQEGGPLQVKERCLGETTSANTLILDFQPLELTEKVYKSIRHAVCGAIL